MTRHPRWVVTRRCRIEDAVQVGERAQRTRRLAAGGLTAGATFSQVKIKGRPRYRLTIETRIKALHYFGWGAHRLRQLDKKAVYTKHFAAEGLRIPFGERFPTASPRMGRTSLRAEPGFRVTNVLDFYNA